jgi:hypothetical protein
MINRLIETGRCYGMEMDVEKIKSNVNIKATIPSTDYDKSKTTGDVEYFNCLVSVVTSDARFTREIKTRISMAKATFNKKLFTSKIDLNFRKKLVKCYIWSIASCGAETWTLRKVDQKYLESFEM